MIEVTTQKQLDAALAKDANAEITLKKGRFELTVRGLSRPTLTMAAGVYLGVGGYDGGKPTVTAWENSTVTAWGYAFVRAFSSRRIEAAPTCIVAIHAEAGAAGMAGVGGGQQVLCPLPDTPQAWCDHYGVEVKDGIAIVYKAVHANYHSPKGYDYSPGLTPVAKDWDEGVAECGGGLHFSPHPEMANAFYVMAMSVRAPKFLACPVALADISVHPRGSYPEKIKARGCIAATWEVDANGKAVTPGLVHSVSEEA